MDPDSEHNQKKIKEEQNSAADLVRHKLDKIYADAPSVKEEIQEVEKLEHQHKRLSKHQKYMEDLSSSGRSLSEIQTAWHDYYNKLPEKEKHEVWQEFYKEHELKRKAKKAESENQNTKPIKTEPQIEQSITKPMTKNEILSAVSSRARKSKKNPKKHSLIFGLSMGFLSVFILMFSFFNERFITPFIRPSQNVSATPIIIDANNVGNAGPEPKIIIPKINVEAPVVFDEPSIDDKSVQKALERGVLHYGTTSNPGEKGNSVIFGHSSGNLLNSGKYKFAFMLLQSLENGDTFIVQKDKKRYVYKVYNKFVTSPNDLSVLDPPEGKTAITTLITCDPPGSSKNRLIVQAEQIYPNPKDNKKSSVDVNAQEKPDQLASNSPSLWQRIKDWF